MRRTGARPVRRLDHADLRGQREAREPGARFRILAYSRTAGFRHSSIDEGITALKLFGSQQGIQVDAIEEPTLFTEEVLSRYDVVVFLDESTYVEQDGSDGVDDDHPISWCKRYDGGRICYMGMGHTEATYLDANFLQHVLGGLEFAAGVATGRVCGAENATGEVTGTVPPTLSLSVDGPAVLGTFIPGVARDYETTLGANVVSSAGDAALTVLDPSTNAPGRRVNGAFALASPLKARVGAAAFAPVSGSPLALKSYASPISNDQVTIDLQQSIAPNDPLRTGTYSKTLVFTLSTTNP